MSKTQTKDVFLKQNFLYLWIILGIILFGYLQYVLWFGTRGYNEYDELLNGITVQEEKNTELNERNLVLSAEVTGLKDGNMAIEERARLDLGLIKPEEIFIQLDMNK